jgi:hypothetical protein
MEDAPDTIPADPDEEDAGLAVGGSSSPDDDREVGIGVGPDG